MTVPEQDFEGFRLSPQQARAWDLRQVAPGADWVARAEVAVRGPLDRRRLRRAVDRAVARHEILRTRFPRPPGLRLPLQVVDAAGRWRWSEQDLRGVPGERAAGGGPRRAAPEDDDLAAGPVLRVSLIRLAEEDHRLLVELPSLCADRVALDDLVDEVVTAYADEGGAAAEPVQHVDLSEWQNELLEAEDTAEARAFWRRRGGDGRPSPAALAARRVPTGGGFSPRTAVEPLTGDELGRAEDAAGRLGHRLPDMLLAAWHLQLGRLCGGEMVVGTAFDGRKYDELAHALGPFLRYLPIAARVEPRRPFTELLAAVAAAVAEAHRWQEYYGWGGSGQAVGPYSFGFDYLPAGRTRLARGASFAVVSRRAPVERADLELVVTGGEAPRLELHFDAAAYGGADVAVLAGQYRALLASLVAAPADSQRGYSLLAPAEGRRLIDELDATARDLGGGTLDDLFTATARRVPHRVAVSGDESFLTYGELDRRSAALAARFAARGAGPERLVALLLDRSPEQVVALLAVLRAGAAWLPLDPEQPPARLAALLAAATPALVVADGRHRHRLPTGTPCCELAAELVEAAADAAQAPPGTAGDPDRAAYVIFTSGSTGRPKGVVVAHRAIVNRVRWMVDAFPLAPGDRVVAKTPWVFDASIWEVFVPLAAGAEVVLAPADSHQDPPRLLDLVRRREVTHLQVVPSLLELLVGEEALARCSSLARVFSGGEALRPAVREAFFARLRRCALHNLYGPTETAIDATHDLCRAGEARPTVPIGRPIANLRVSVVDDLGRPAATGETGELWVGGTGLARCYLAAPAATAEAFRPDPHPAAPGGRLYRTGDLARRTVDGRLEYVGRRDSQVKLRGVRIELGEIEAALAARPDVRQAVAVVREETAGPMLVAYAVPVAESVIDGDALRADLEERLPRAFVPAVVVVLDELPRTASGKIDRAALPAPASRRRAGRRPSGPSEEAIAAVWTDLLGLDEVGADDDFFAVGGHSLLATQLLSRLRDSLGVELPLRSLFERPTVAALAATADAAARGTGGEEPLVPVARGGELPLSFGQQRLWFIDQLQPGSAAYHIVSAVALDGRLDLAVLRRTLGEVVRRHEVLRTSFPAVGGRPRQVVAPAEPLFAPVIDLSALPPEAREAESLSRLGEASLLPFDLATGPLFRVLVVRLAARSHAVALVLHHIVSDGWSSALLVREVAALYEAFAAGRPSPLPELPVQYADFAVWQRRRLVGEELERQVAYWRARLAGAPASLELPLDRPRPAAPRHTAEVATRVLARRLEEDVAAFGRRRGATRFMVLLAALQALLHRVCGQDDVVIGSPTAGRTRSELESLVGFFVNTLPMRARFPRRLDFAGLVDQVREAAIEAQAYQDLPFERLVDELEVERSLHRTPIFQVVFALQNLPMARLRLPELTLAPIDLPGRTAKFDLTLTVHEVEAGLVASLEYRTELFDRSTAERLLSRLELLLAAALAAPEERLGRLPVMEEDERRQVLVEWNPAQRTWPRGLLHGRFGERAREAPDRVAVVAGGEHLSFGELDRRARALGRRLGALGVGAETTVALFLDRSPRLVEAVLGVLAAGGAYVPLDPTLPAERLAFLLDDAAAPLVLSDSSLAARLPDGRARVLLLDLPAEGPADEADPAPPPADALAYVIYTSGSTGRPKGVGVSHANVLPLLDATERHFGFGADDVWTLFHSYAFDFSVWELWGALAYGGRLIVVPYAVSRSPEDFLALLERERVTVLNQTPSAFRQLVVADGHRAAAGGTASLALRRVVFGGEALDTPSLAPWFARHGDERPLLVNMYGITETTVHVTYRPLGAADPAGGSRIGRAIDDLRLYLLDRGGEPVPIGVAGEIHVGGDGVARGYLGRPGLTAERFVPDPFAAAPGGRLYRSGDLACWRSGGDVEYLGRLDDQVKVRGFRIELGEIEAALAAHPTVAEAVVVVREDAPGERRLVAYAVAAPGAVVEPADLRRDLASRLPDYMVPAAVVCLDGLPLTANGKLDRGALPVPQTARSAAPAGVAETPAEEVLAAVWAQVLRLDAVGVEESFFALGGDSILTAQVLARARERGLDFSLADLFEHQTVRALARVARWGGADGEPAAASAPFALLPEEERRSLPEDVEDAYPLTLLQAGMLYHMQLAPDDPPYHNVDSAHLAAPFEAATFTEAVRRVVARHPVLRTSFRLTGFAEPVQLVHREVAVEVPVEDLRGLPDEEQERLLAAFRRAEKRRPFDLAVPPQLRFFVHRRSDHTFQLTFTENHAILDGWSLHATLAEVFDLYFALLDGETPAPQPPPAYAFRDFVAVERQARDDRRSREFWRAALDGVTVTRIPRWGRPAVSAGSRLQVLPAELPVEVSQGLKALARDAAVPLKSVLLAAHFEVLAAASGERDVVTGVTTHGRPDEPGAGEARGLFLNTLPLRLALPRGSWRQLAEAAFAAERAMLPHRLMPAAALRRERQGAPLFEVAFNYVHFHVVGDLVRSQRLEVLSFERSEGTNFALLAGFGQNLVTGRVGLQLEYDAAEYDGRQVADLAARYARVLAAMAASPSSDHAAADLLSPEERRQVLVGWSSARRDHALAERPLHALIAEQAARTPDRVAVRCAGSDLSYGELDVLTARLAARLRRHGVGPDELVPVAARRSLELVVGLLAVLRAGGAYVPLDPDHPRERLADVLAEVRPRVVLAQGRLIGRLPELPAPVIDLDRLGEVLAGEEPAPPAAVDPDALAYAIYTSGSTGRPKGAMNTHRAIVNRLLWMQRRYRLGADDRVLQKTPYGFDVSVWELFWPLLAGARMVVARPEGHRDPSYLAGLIADEGVTTVHFVPSMLQLFVAAPESAAAGCLRRVVASGEALPRDLVERFSRRLPGVELHNLYGPTEAAVDVSAWDCAEAAEVDAVPIGRPIDNLRLLVLDRDLRPAPVGAPGELAIGGVGLARGYLRRPALTAERFVPDPFGGESDGAEAGGRLYRTGDLARWLPDGSLDFLGRLDHQVKLHGFRVELGEVEAALAADDGVREAVVVHDDRGAGRLVAFLVPAGEPPSAERLREVLARRLPDAMVPSRFVTLDAMPLNASGKIDRRALPLPGDERPDVGRPYVAPGDATEAALAAVWSRVLGIERVGVDDDFFALGGDSIRSIQVVAEAREAGLDLSLQQLLDHPSIRRLAPRVDWGVTASETAAGGAPFALVAADERRSLPADLDDAYPLTALQGGMLFHSAYEPETAIYHDVVTHHLALPLDEGAVRRALERVVARHPVLRTSFDLIAFREPMQLVHRQAEVPVAVEDLSHLPAEAQEARARAWVEEEKHRPFDLSRPPLLRAVVQRRGESSFQFGVGFHHAVLDGWSLASLLGELFQIYRTLLGEVDDEVPAMPSATFRDYVALERQAVGSAATLAFWDGELEGYQPTRLPRWPRRRDEPGVDSLEVALDAATGEGVRRLAAAAEAPLKSVLLAAHLRALALATGADHASTGLVVNGRPETAGGDRVLGLFLNSLPFRLATGGGSWLELVRDAFAAERRLHPHRRLPLAELQRRRGGGSLFETAFHYTHFHVLAEAGQGSGVEVLGSHAFERTDFTLLAGFHQSLGDGRLGLRLTWDRRTLDRAQVRALADRYARVLAAMAADPRAPVARTPAVSPAERQQVLVEWNDTSRSPRRPGDLGRRVAAVSRSRPDAVALVGGDLQLTYGELDRRARSMAGHLRQAGVGVETQVALLVERSVELVVATLAVVYAGGAYVPLDPRWPRQRLAALLSELGTAVAVCDARGEEAVEGLEPLRRLRLDLALASAAEGGEPAELSPDNLAYVMFTSGSTGRPKAVAVPHRGVLRLVDEPGYARLGADDVLLHFAPPSFDAATLEVWGALAHGGRLAVHPAGAASLDDLVAAVARHGVTSLWLTAGLFHQAVDARLAGLAGLRQLLAGGDALSGPHVERALAALPATVINGYGPTENTTFTCCHAMAAPADRGLGASVPLGRPVPETWVRVLDRGLAPVPIGAPGELYAGGSGLARGYLGQPALTAERFVPDPLAVLPGERLYRTGDQARWLPDGRLEFLGRLDRQVKVRGFRVEPGEVEAALAAEPAVREAAVVARPTADGEGRRLVAYVVAAADAPGAELERELAEALRSRLPEYLVPQGFVFLPALPLTANGKVDRAALPDPGAAVVETPYVAPSSIAEELIAELCRDLLGVERVGLDDDLFVLGAHSLTATRLAARLGDAFQLDFPLRRLFEAPTVAGVLAEIAGLAGGREAVEQIAALYREVEGLSDDDVRSRLA